jgi:hypothetical protein
LYNEHIQLFYPVIGIESFDFLLRSFWIGSWAQVGGGMKKMGNLIGRIFNQYRSTNFLGEEGDISTVLLYAAVSLRGGYNEMSKL